MRLIPVLFQNEECSQINAYVTFWRFEFLVNMKTLLVGLCFGKIWSDLTPLQVMRISEFGVKF